MVCAATLVLPVAGAEPRARDSALASSAVIASRLPGDACGGRGALDAIVPDGPFLEACKFHDACYRSGVLDQGRCDADFLADMQTACRTTYPATDKLAEHALCQAAALTYFKAVNSRFGSLLYPGGETSGELSGLSQTVQGRQLNVCADATNTSNRKLRYYVTLHDATGAWVATAPLATPAVLQPGASERLCAGTHLSLFRNAESLGPNYALVLKADDPTTLNPFGDLIAVDRFDCDTASGACRRVTP